MQPHNAKRCFGLTLVRTRRYIRISHAQAEAAAVARAVDAFAPSPPKNRVAAHLKYFLARGLAEAAIGLQDAPGGRSNNMHI